MKLMRYLLKLILVKFNIWQDMDNTLQLEL